MLRKLSLLNLFVLAAILFTACTPAEKTPEALMNQSTKTADIMMQPTDTMMDHGTPTADAMMQPTDTMMDHGTPTADAMMHPTESVAKMPEANMPEANMPEASTPGASMGQSIPSTGMNDAMMASWAEKELTNPASSQTFKINDFKGKVVLVETFAQWCPTCLAQQQEVEKLHKMLGMQSDLISVSLDIDPNEDETMLKAYLDKHGFGWNFAVATADISREISMMYGAQFLNPTSAPMLVIDRKGEAHLLPFGIKSAEDLQKALEPYLQAGM